MNTVLKNSRFSYKIFPYAVIRKDCIRIGGIRCSGQREREYNVQKASDQAAKAAEKVKNNAARGTAVVRSGAATAANKIRSTYRDLHPKKKRGDRYDGKRVDVDAIHYAMVHLYNNRTDAEVFINETFDVSKVLEYVDRKNEEDPSFKTKPWHVFVQAVAKTVYERPMLNRFICGRRVYDRNKVIMGFMVKQEFEDGAEELMLMANARPEMVLDDMSHLILGDTRKLRKGDGESSATEKILNVYKHLPRNGQRAVIETVKWLDYHGILPPDIIETQIHHATVLMSNLGSIKCDAPYHHLNNFGTNSIVCTVGEIHKAPMYDENGEAHVTDVVDFGLTLDERIADGFYFAKSVKVLKYILEHPEVLDKPLSEPLGIEF